MAPTTRTQAHPTSATTPPANVLQPTQAVEPSTTQPDPTPKVKRGPGRPRKRKAADDIDTGTEAAPLPASTTQSGSKRKKTKANSSTTSDPSANAANSLSTPNPPSAHIPTTAHLVTGPNAQLSQPPSLSTSQIPDSVIDPALLTLPPVAIPQPQPQPASTSDQPLAAVGSVPIPPSFPIAPSASASMSSAANQAPAPVAEAGSVTSATNPEATVGPSTRHQAQRAPTFQQALKQLEELKAENKQLHADLRTAKKYKVLYAKEIAQKGKVDLPVTGNLIPRPPGEKGKNGWNLQEVLGLKDDFATYNASELLRSVRHCISRSGLDWEATYSEQDAARLGACFKEIKKSHPFLERFVGDWPAKEMVINALQNRRKALNAKARVKDEESQGTDQRTSASDGVQAGGNSNSE